MTTVARRSCVHERLIAAGGTDWRPAHGGQVPGYFGEPEAERRALARLALADLSLYPRTGFKGAGAPEWLTRQGVLLPEPNYAQRQADGTLALRLAPREVLLLPGRTGEHDFASLEAAWHAASVRRRGWTERLPGAPRRQPSLVPADRHPGPEDAGQALRRRPADAQVRAAGRGPDPGRAHLRRSSPATTPTCPPGIFSRIARPLPTCGTACWMRWPSGRADRSGIETLTPWQL